ncbi:hypothetical protein ANN_21291 [Periplaneta americana]|uniref:Mos1 transposase HTH domain-containing protein n=1 Tax=Periplaneta americana TaxID=6978 RepID=A0ABQ8SFD0_PERAM|nr:hypothetical protein ANN_21291 [Periplaneta americana]
MPKQRWTIIQPEWRYRVVSMMIPSAVIAVYERSPKKPTTRASRELNTPQPMVWRVLKYRLHMKPYKLQLLQALYPDDHNNDTFQDVGLEEEEEINFIAGKIAAETVGMLWEVFNDDVLGKSQVYEWFSRFKSGNMSTEDMPCPGRPSTGRNDENIAKIKRTCHGARSSEF